jgi:hypothetical protein
VRRGGAAPTRGSPVVRVDEVDAGDAVAHQYAIGPRNGHGDVVGQEHLLRAADLRNLDRLHGGRNGCWGRHRGAGDGGGVAANCGCGRGGGAARGDAAESQAMREVGECAARGERREHYWTQARKQITLMFTKLMTVAVAALDRLR